MLEHRHSPHKSNQGEDAQSQTPNNQRPPEVERLPLLHELLEVEDGEDVEGDGDVGEVGVVFGEGVVRPYGVGEVGELIGVVEWEEVGVEAVCCLMLLF